LGWLKESSNELLLIQLCVAPGLSNRISRSTRKNADFRRWNSAQRTGCRLKQSPEADFGMRNEGEMDLDAARPRVLAVIIRSWLQLRADGWRSPIRCTSLRSFSF
jgi:hypothetical protein